MYGLLVISFFILFFISYRTVNLIRNYLVARSLGIPVILSPVSWQDAWWLPIQPLFLPLKCLPFRLGEWVTYSTLGWALEHRFSKHHEVGPIFAIVSPQKTEFAVSDPKAAAVLLGDWKIWTKNPDLYKLFEVFGKNVNTVGEEDWPRHRKIMSYGFKESNYKIVWERTIRQIQGMARVWEIKSKTTGEVTFEDLDHNSGTLSLHVLAATLWGEDYEFDSGLGGHKPPLGHRLTYGDALKEIMNQILLTLLFDALVLPSWFMPKTLRKVKIATQEYRQYLEEKVTSERELIAQGGDERANLSAMLVAANEKAKSEEVKTGEKNRGFLTDDELYGNFFMLTLAGHETTASSVAYSIALLSCHPEVLSWVRAEVDLVFSLSKPYELLYPKLIRVMAIMYETLRIWGPVANLDKYSRDNHSGQPLAVGGTTYLIPASTYVTVNFHALHTDPQYWGEDSMIWRPQRWVAPTTKPSIAESSSPFNEQLSGPPEGATFVAWALGARDCPGKKFSKVEFVALFAYLLKNYDIKPALRGNESLEVARERLNNVVKDSYMKLGPKFKRPRDAGIVLTTRK